MVLRICRGTRFRIIPGSNDRGSFTKSGPNRAVFRADAHGGAADFSFIRSSRGHEALTFRGRRWSLLTSAATGIRRAAFRVIARGVQPSSSKWVELVEFEPLLFARVLDAGFAEVQAGEHPDGRVPGSDGGSGSGSDDGGPAGRPVVAIVLLPG
jgi:hypothetical protein